MTGYSSDHNSQESLKNNHSEATNDLEEIRRLLFEPEITQFKKVQERLDNLNLNTDHLSEVLPKAIAQRALPDNELTQALLPTVEDAIHISVRKDVDVIATAIFPALLPGIQKAVAAAISEMTQSLNQTLEHAFSSKSFRWRLEARLTGKSFAEVVLLHTLLYQVEQVFLIHKESGLVLQHLVAPDVAAEDADMVSAMLTAIHNFIQGSFNVDKNDSLDALRFGGLALWIEQGSQAILAGVIRGNAPKELRCIFQDALAKIHLKYSNKLDSFEGDTELLLESQNELAVCLQAQYESIPQKPSPVLWIVLGSIAAAFTTWVGLTIQDNLRWSTYLTKLNNEPGIVITKAEKHWGKYFISGLRDPLALDPERIMQAAKLNPKTVISQWKPYISLEPVLLTARVKKLLKPPVTVSLTVDENGILYATGSAPQQWIVETRKRIEVIPGINQFQEKDLVNSNLNQFELQDRLKNKYSTFRQLMPNSH